MFALLLHKNDYTSNAQIVQNFTQYVQGLFKVIKHIHDENPDLIQNEIVPVIKSSYFHSPLFKKLNN